MTKSSKNSDNFFANLRKNSKNNFKSRALIFALATVFAFAGIWQLFAPQNVAQADEFDEKIKAIESQIDGYNSKSSELAAQADTLNNKIAELQNQQSQIQAQIDLSNAKKAEFESKIAANEAKIKTQSSALAQTLLDKYYSGETSTLDILLNSNSVSDYVDKSAQQDYVSEQITKSVGEIQKIQDELKSQKAEVEKIIAQQKAQKDQLAATQSEQQKLLAETEGKEENYQNLIAKSKEEKAEIQRQQMAYIASLKNKGNSQTIANSQCGGGYPFCNSAPDSTQYLGGFQALGNARECVSYVQWRIFRITGINERHGNANTWPRTQSSPSVDSVGVVTSGIYGHVVWVEEIGTGARAGQIRVSEYNWSPFAYTERWTNASAFNGFYKNW